MITRLKISNFKSLRELEVEFGRLTVIVGANGCGKSSVLQAILAVRELVEGDNKPLWTSRSKRPGLDELEDSVAFEVTTDEHAFGGKLTNSGNRPPSIETWPREQQLVTALVQKWAEHIELYQFDRSFMEKPAYSDEPNPVLGQRGQALPAVLDAMQGEHREQFVAIEVGLCEFIDGLQRIRLRRVQIGDGIQPKRIGHQILFDFKHARGIPADQSSEGTVLLLGLLTVIGTEPGPPTTIMLDDLDRGLHPKAQKQLIDYLRKLLDQRPDLQIIATTHSPYLVEHLKYEEVLAMTLSPEDGRSLIAPLAEHPDAERWQDEMSAGEFWSSVGEEWVARGR